MPNLKTATQDLSSFLETATRFLAKQESWYGETATNDYGSPFDKSVWMPQAILDKFG